MSETYSIPYNDYKDGDSWYASYAIDWDWMISGQWARSDKDGPGSGWYHREGLDERSYQALLEHFGLQDRAGEFPMERVITMNPQELEKAGKKNPASTNQSETG